MVVDSLWKRGQTRIALVRSPSAVMIETVQCCAVQAANQGVGEIAIVSDVSLLPYNSLVDSRLPAIEVACPTITSREQVLTG